MFQSPLNFANFSVYYNQGFTRHLARVNDVSILTNLKPDKLQSEVNQLETKWARASHGWRWSKRREVLFNVTTQTQISSVTPAMPYKQSISFSQIENQTPIFSLHSIIAIRRFSGPLTINSHSLLIPLSVYQSRNHTLMTDFIILSTS